MMVGWSAHMVYLPASLCGRISSGTVFATVSITVSRAGSVVAPKGSWVTGARRGGSPRRGRGRFAWHHARTASGGGRSTSCDRLLIGSECQREAPACWPATLQPRWGAPGDDQVE